MTAPRIWVMTFKVITAWMTARGATHDKLKNAGTTTATAMSR
jgi:hypothetical protein